jgi:hypothetical protein
MRLTQNVSLVIHKRLPLQDRTYSDRKYECWLSGQGRRDAQEGPNGGFGPDLNDSRNHYWHPVSSDELR